MITPIKRSPQRQQQQQYITYENLGQNINETIDLEFFKKNKVKEFKDERKYHVEKVLDRVFPSAEKEERKLKHMMNQQTYLYEGYIDTEVVPEEDQNGSY